MKNCVLFPFLSSAAAVNQDTTDDINHHSISSKYMAKLGTERPPKYFVNLLLITFAKCLHPITT
uniref:Uncharacterized protein n=1 Tax=Rhizophora mucronata TaxID=61149 RepID=A0A2P2NGG4_RHIMU